MKPLRVLEVVGNAEMGGVERHVAALALHMRGDAEVAGVVVPGEGPFVDLLRQHALPVYPIAMPPWGMQYHALADLCDLIRTLQIDLVHTHYGMGHPCGQTAAVLCGVPGVATVHGCWINSEEVMLPAMYGTHLICVCYAGRTSATDMGIPAEGVSVVYNGVDIERFTPASDVIERGMAIRRQFGIADEQRLVGFVGRLSWEKGPQHFVGAAPLVLESIPDVTFILAGNGDPGVDAEMRALAAPLGERFVFTGLLDDIPAIDAVLDVVVSTSLSEGTPLALIEAMAMGKPVVAPSVGGVPELIHHEETGLLVPCGDEPAIAAAIMRLLNDPGKAQRLGMQAQAEARHHFSIETMARETAGVLRSVYDHYTPVRK